MAAIDLTRYGITGTTEIIYNPSYEDLFKDEMDPSLEGYDKGTLTELGKYLIKGYAHRDRQSQLAADAVAQRVRQGARVSAEQMERVGHVQPALVDAEGLDEVGILIVDRVDAAGIVLVQGVMRRQQDEGGTFFLRLPDRLGGLDAEGLSALVLGEDDAVALLGVAADRDGHVPQLRTAEQLHAGKKAVEVTVQDHALHRVRPLSRHSIAQAIFFVNWFIHKKNTLSAAVIRLFYGKKRILRGRSAGVMLDFHN